MSNLKTIDLRVALNKSGIAYQNFKKIKKALGLKNNSETLRFILKQAAKMPLANLLEESMQSESIEVSE
ncbi:MAG: hypothetical protein R6U96_18670 [Promethearchaeia archaeon]